MPAIQLVFDQPQSGLPAQLLFGATPDSGTPPPPAEEAAPHFFVSARIVHRHQDARATTTTTTKHRQQQAQPLIHTATHHQHNALKASRTTTHRNASAQLKTRTATHHHQDALLPNPRSVLHRHQDAQALFVQTSSHWQDARLINTSTTTRWQDCLRPIRTLGAHWQDAQSTAKTMRAWNANALLLNARFIVRWQDALRASGGLYVPPPPPPQPPCWQANANGYVPLLFQQPYSDAMPAGLVFICQRNHYNQPPAIPALLVIPQAKAYIMINTITLRRTTDNQPLAALGFSMRLDKDAYTWSFNATLPASMLPFIHDSNQAKPLAITATVQGAEYKLLVTRVGRTESFGDDVIAIQGKGIAAVLGQPYAPSRSFNNTAARTAQQLTADALTNNGVGIGWTVDWFLTDWLVPAAAWSHQGTYISALADIASAVGGYVQPHATANKLLLKPLYPHKPWELATATPDVELPASAAEVVQTDWIEHPEYNAIYVSGQSMGKLGKVKRQGTAGDKHMPMVTHPLITAVQAVTQRGLAELGSQGKKTMRQIKTPVFNDVGVIVPGTTLRYVDKQGQPFTGITRSVSVDGNSMPVLTQTIGVEFHGEQT